MDNRLLLAGLHRVALLGDLAAEDACRLSEEIHAFSEWATPCVPSRTDFENARQRYDRLNEHYSVAHRACEMLLFSGVPNSLFEIHRDEGVAITVDMATLFECCVEKFVHELLGPKHSTLECQPGDRGAFLNGMGETYSHIRPDLEIRRGSKCIAVLDAKYKPLWSSASNGEPKNKIANDDLYQMFFYQSRLAHRVSPAPPPLAFLVAPLPSDEERGGALPISEKYRHVRWVVDHDKGELILLLLPITEYLRAIRTGKHPNPRKFLVAANPENGKTLLELI